MRIRIIVGLFLGIAVIISCALANKKNQKIEDNMLGLENDKPLNPNPIPKEPDQKEPNMNEDILEPIIIPENGYSYKDGKILDDRLLKEAKYYDMDEKNYRLHVRKNVDGSNIFRALGMFVIVNPNGQEVFLPDEI